MMGKKIKTYPLRPGSDSQYLTDKSRNGGEMVEMTPDEFLSKGQELTMDGHDKRVIKKFKKKMKKGKKLDPLRLYNGGGQDGRHRAMAAKKLGIDEVPVIDYRDSDKRKNDYVKLAKKISKKITD